MPHTTLLRRGGATEAVRVRRQLAELGPEAGSVRKEDARKHEASESPLHVAHSSGWATKGVQVIMGGWGLARVRFKSKS